MRHSESEDDRHRRLASLVSRLLAETVDLNAAVLTSLDLQARILSNLEGLSRDEAVDEVSGMLKERRRELLRELDSWTDSLADDSVRN